MRYFPSNQESTSTTRDAGVNLETEPTSDVGHEPQVPKGSGIETGAQASSTPHPSQTAMVSYEKVYSPWYKYIVEKLENNDAFPVKHEKSELVDKLIRLLEKEKYTREINEVTELIWMLKQEKKEKRAIQKELQKEKQLRVCIQGEKQLTVKQLKKTTAKLETNEAKLQKLQKSEHEKQKAVLHEQEQRKETKSVLASKEQEIAKLRKLLQEEKIAELRVLFQTEQVQQVTEKLREEMEKLITIHELVAAILY